MDDAFDSGSHDNWEVLWEIENFETSEPLAIAGVEFLPLEGPVAQRLVRPQGHPLREFIDEALLGKTFGRVFVVSSTKEAALQKGKVQIVQALSVLRVAMLSLLNVHPQQRLQRIGIHYYVVRLEDMEKHVGSKFGFVPYPLTIQADHLEALRVRISELGFAFTENSASTVRERLWRALVYFGSSLEREDPGEKLVYLCTSLECIYCSSRGGSKAARIAVNHALAAIELGEPTFLSPLDFFDVYQIRNEIVHEGSSSPIGSRLIQVVQLSVSEALEFVAHLLERSPNVESLEELFLSISSADSLSVLRKAIEKANDSGSGRIAIINEVNRIENQNFTRRDSSKT